MKFLRVVGARPQFMQAAMFRKAVVKRGHQEILVHTGQHYDNAMSDIFFQQLEIPKPDFNLQVGSGTHGYQTGRMLSLLDEIINSEDPDAVIVDGDTNSTLAGALSAIKMHRCVVHIEAGCRSYDRSMPEEVNRVIVDHIADLLCAPTINAMNNLSKENLSNRSILTGDVLFDCFLFYKKKANMNILKELHITPGRYILATVHRSENTSSITPLQQILSALNQLPNQVIFMLHPRTRLILEKNVSNYHQLYKNITFSSPLGYLEMLALELNAQTIFTDSGGVVREAFFSRVPSVILRDVTEWVEQLEQGWSILGGTKTENILMSYNKLMNQARQTTPIYGDGHSAEKILSAIEDHRR